MGDSTAGDAPPAEFFLATPSDWVHLDVSENGPEAARRMVEALPVEDTPDKRRLRAQVIAGLQRSIRQAREQGAVMAAFWFLPIGELTLGASLTVAFAPLGPGPLMVRLGTEARQHAAAGLAEALGRADDVLAADVVDLPAAGHAARIRRRKVVDAFGEAREALVVQYYVPVPRRPQMLVLTYSTPTIELVDALTDLFDSLASSLRWRS
jgi:hypothetical protein